MKIQNFSKDWEFNVIGLYNYKKIGRFKPLFDFITEQHRQLEGDIVEVGVYKGFSLLAIALLLKELKSDKKVFGFDSFSGFPPASDPNDELDCFEELYRKKEINKELWEEVQYYWKTISLVRKATPNQFNISTSGSFSDTSLMLLENKINLLGLDNIVLVKGFFEETMTDKQLPEKIFAANLDCDLYKAHKTSLPFLWKRLTPGGYIWLDEYYSLKFPGARKATNEFFQNKKEKPQMYPLQQGDFERWYIKKQKE